MRKSSHQSVYCALAWQVFQNKCLFFGVHLQYSHDTTILFLWLCCFLHCSVSACVVSSCCLCGAGLWSWQLSLHGRRVVLLFLFGFFPHTLLLATDNNGYVQSLQHQCRLTISVSVPVCLNLHGGIHAFLIIWVSKVTLAVVGTTITEIHINKCNLVMWGMYH